MSNGPSGDPPPGSADELPGPTVLRMILGTQLRRLREAASCPRWRPEASAGGPPAEVDAFGGVGRKP